MDALIFLSNLYASLVHYLFNYKKNEYILKTDTGFHQTKLESFSKTVYQR